MTAAPTEAEARAGQDVAAADAAQRLVKMIDAAMTHGDGDGPGDGAHVASAWARIGNTALRLRDGVVEVDGIDCGAAGEELGLWPKLLSDAGVRTIQPGRHLTNAAFSVLRNALITDPVQSAETIQALRVWIWSGGPFGLRCELGPALWQAPARLGFDVPSRAELDAVRATAVQRGTPSQATPWPGALAQIERACASRGAHHQLRFEADNAERWIEDCLAAHAPMRPSEAEAGASTSEASTDAPPHAVADVGLATPNADAVAGVMREQIAFGAGLGLGEVWDGLAARDLAVATALRAAFPAVEVGREVGRALPIDGAVVEQIEALLQGGSDFAAGVASGLLQRAVDARTVEGVSALLQRLGLPRVWQMADLSGIEGQPAKGLALVLKKLDAGPTLWADLVGAAPPHIAAWILKGSPPHILSRVGGQLRAKFVSQPPEETAPLVEALIGMDASVPLRAVGEALRETRGKDWSGKLVPAVCQALLKHRMGEELLVPLFLDRGAETALRLLVLRSLDNDPELLEMATRFRFGELVEPKQIQARLKAARKKLKAQR